MRRSKESLPTEESGGEDGPENIESEKERIFKENEGVIGRDSIFRNIISSIEEGWPKLSPDKKREILAGFSELVQKITSYHDSYTRLKGISHFKLSASAGTDAIKRYQGEVTEADRIERILHNSFLDSVNILARFMKRTGLDISWYSDEKIYDADYDTMRTKVKHWMFEVFAERV